MTLIASICCKDGVLIAADSKGTEASTGNVLIDQSFQTQKLFPLGQWIIWGSAGSGGVSQRAQVALDADYAANAAPYAQRPSVEDRIRLVAAAVIRQEFAALTLPLNLALQMKIPPHGQAFLIAGMDNGIPWVTEILWDGQMTHYANQGFHAIGSGGLAALTTYQLLQHHGAKDAPLELARVLLYRIVDTCIKSSSGGLGPPIQMWEITNGGARQIPSNELRAITDTVGIWETKEQQCLREVSTTTDNGLDEGNEPRETGD